MDLQPGGRRRFFVGVGNFLRRSPRALEKSLRSGRNQAPAGFGETRVHFGQTRLHIALILCKVQPALPAGRNS
jgi:hypothetical protein